MMKDKSGLVVLTSSSDSSDADFRSTRTSQLTKRSGKRKMIPDKHSKAKTSKTSKLVLSDDSEKSIPDGKSLKPSKVVSNLSTLRTKRCSIVLEKQKLKKLSSVSSAKHHSISDSDTSFTTLSNNNNKIHKVRSRKSKRTLYLSQERNITNNFLLRKSTHSSVKIIEKDDNIDEQLPICLSDSEVMDVSDKEKSDKNVVECNNDDVFNIDSIQGPQATTLGDRPETSLTRVEKSPEWTLEDWRSDKVIEDPEDKICNLLEEINDTNDQSTSRNYAFCQICSKNITSYSIQKRELHVNNCCDVLDHVEAVESIGDVGDVILSETIGDVGDVILSETEQTKAEEEKEECIICQNKFERKKLLSHLRSCAKRNDKDYLHVKELVKAMRKATTKVQPKGKQKQNPDVIPQLVLDQEKAQHTATRVLTDLVLQEDFTEEISSTPAFRSSKLTYSRKNSSSGTSTSNSWCTAASRRSSNAYKVQEHNNSIMQTQKTPSNQSADDTAETMNDQLDCSALNFEDSEPSLDTSAVKYTEKEQNATTGPSSPSAIPDLTEFLESLAGTPNIADTLLSPVKGPTDNISITIKNSKTILSKPSQLEPFSFTVGNLPLNTQKQPEKKEEGDESDVDIIRVVERSENEDDENDRLERPDKSPNSSAHSDIEDELPSVMLDKVHVSLNTESSASFSTKLKKDLDVTFSMEKESEVSLNDSAEKDLGDDSNIDLFVEETPCKSPAQSSVDYDRSLLNVSPITEYEPISEQPTNSKQALPDQDNFVPPHPRPAPYRKSFCTSTSGEKVNIAHSSVQTTIPPTSFKESQTSLEYRTASTQSELRVSDQGTSTDKCSSTTAIQVCPETVIGSCQVDKVAMVTVSTATEKNSTNQYVQTHLGDGGKALQEQLLRLLHNLPGADLAITCSDKKVVHAHNCIVVSGCNNFFKVYPTQDGHRVTVDMSQPTTMILLEFIYSHTLPDTLSQTVWEELNRVQHKLNIPHLAAILSTHAPPALTYQLHLTQPSGETLLLDLSQDDILELTQRAQNRALNDTQSVTSAAEIDLNDTQSVTSAAEIDVSDTESVTSPAVEIDVNVLESIPPAAEIDLNDKQSVTSAAEIDISDTESVTSPAEIDVNVLQSIPSATEIDLSDTESLTSPVEIDVNDTQPVTSATGMDPNDSQSVPSAAEIQINLNDSRSVTPVTVININDTELIKSPAVSQLSPRHDISMDETDFFDLPCSGILVGGCISPTPELSTTLNEDPVPLDTSSPTLKNNHQKESTIVNTELEKLYADIDNITDFEDEKPKVNSVNYFDDSLNDNDLFEHLSSPSDLPTSPITTGIPSAVDHLAEHDVPENKSPDMLFLEMLNSFDVTDLPSSGAFPIISLCDESTSSPSTPESSRNIFQKFQKQAIDFKDESFDRTPQSSKRRKLDLDLSVYQKTPVFDKMNTPVLKQKIEKFGLKPLSKKKAVAKLTEIHRFTNKKFLKVPEEKDDQIEIGKKGKKTMNCEKSGAVQKMKPSTSSRKEKISSRKESGSASKKRERVVLSSSDSDSEKGLVCPVGDITVIKPSHSKKEATAKMLKSLLKKSEDLYLEILQYKPVDIITIKMQLETEKGHKVGVGLLAEVLDEMGITFINSKTRKEKTLKSTQRPKKKAKEKKKNTL